MKIGINSFGCNHGRSGIGSYILSIVQNLPKTEDEIELFGHELDRYTYTSNTQVSFTGISIADTDTAEKFWHFKNLNGFIKKQKYELVLFPTGIDFLPARFAVPSVLVIQKLISPTLNSFTRLTVKRALQNAAGIISPTNFIQKDLVDLGIPKSKIKVIRNGLDTGLFNLKSPSESETLIMQPFAIRKPYIIYASQLTHPNKHHVELIKAFSIFKKKSGAAHRLVIAGSDGDNSEAVHKAVIDSGYSSDILLTGYFPHESLAQLYAGAELCIFPSAIEGVGLPVIEAMACGVPVACANAGALPEVAGDASLYFNPQDIEEIANSIAALTDTPENSERRKTLIEAGLSWVKKYDWETTALRTIEFISSLK